MDVEAGRRVRCRRLLGCLEARLTPGPGHLRSRAVILSCRRAADGPLIVLLAPTTHSELAGAAAIEIQPKVKAHLGLDQRGRG
jgi:hypothetical protein